MKIKTFTLLLLLITGFISNSLSAQQRTFIPDKNFEQALIDLGYDNVLDNYVVNSNIINITNLDLRSKNIGTLTGIESFTGLINLNISFNSIAKLDVTNNTKLKELYCAFNSLTSLDLSKNMALTYLDCGFNNLTLLDVHSNKFLSVLYSDYNSLVSLNVKNGNNTNFKNFDVSKNPDLKCIEVDNANYSTNNWPKKDAASSYNCNGGEPTELTYIPDTNFEQALIALGYDTVLDGYVATTNISNVTDLNVAKSGIKDLTGIEAFSSLTTLNCSLNAITNLDLSKNLLLTNLICFYNSLVTLNVKNGNNKNFTNFDARYNPDLNCINVDDVTYSNRNWSKKDAASTYNINCDSGGSIGLTSIPDTNFEQALIALGYDTVLDGYVATTNISNVTDLNVAKSGIKDLTGIEAFSSLTTLNCSLNAITNLDLSKNLLLTNLICFYNSLVTLNVKNGNNKNFTNFDARYNPDLNCINVDDVTYSNRNWSKKDAASTYNINCDSGGSIGLTSIPDTNFEQALIALGYDTVLDGYVATTNISNVTDLNVAKSGIKDLTGIEAFSSLTTLNCSLNAITNLDLSKNLLLTNLICFYNSLVTLNVKNGNNKNFTNFDARYNPDLNCINVDDVTYSNRNWSKKDATATYNINCGVSGLAKSSSNSKGMKMSDVSNSAAQLEKSKFKLYPNPVKDILNINLDYGILMQQVNFYNTYGQRVFSANTSQIDVSNFLKGIYFVEIETNQGKSTKKIIVE